VFQPAASNRIFSCSRSGYRGIIQNQIFLFAYMRLFLSGFHDSQHCFLITSEIVTSPKFQCTFITPQLTIKKLFLNFIVFFKYISCFDVLITCITHKGKYFDSASTKKRTTTIRHLISWLNNQNNKVIFIIPH